MRAYLREHWRVIAAFFAFTAVFGVTFALYGLPLEAVAYPAGLCALAGAGMAVWDFRRAARRHSLPRAGWLPGGCTPGEDHCFPAACDGFSPHQISVCVPPARLPGGAAQKNIFSGARVFVPEYRPRAYCALI